MLEKDRQRIRAGNGFSYNSQSFEECRASARFQTDSDCSVKYFSEIPINLPIFQNLARVHGCYINS